MAGFEHLSLSDRSLNIARRVTTLVGEHLIPAPTGIDYVSIFPHGEDDYDRLCGAADSIGDVIFYKNGPTYRLSNSLDLGFPTDVIRIREPDPNQTLEGCADMIVDDYETTRRELEDAPSYIEALKDGYRITHITDTDLAVAAYFPSVRLTPRLEAAARAAAARQLED